jgi:CRISPR-associated protein Cmr6
MPPQNNHGEGERYPLPQDTQAILLRLKHPTRACSHIGLLLERYLPSKVILKEDHINDLGRKDGQWPSFWLSALKNAVTWQTSADLISAMYARWQVTTRDAHRFEMRTQGRLIVGLGNKGPLEIGFTLHHTTGLPIIPGSALKGLCRTYALLTIAAAFGIVPQPARTTTEPSSAGGLPQPANTTGESSSSSPDALACLDAALVAPDGTARKKALAALGQALKRENQRAEVTAERLQESTDARLFRACFGSQDNAGACVFHEAVLVPERPGASTSLFDLDVMTPHFQSYYSAHGQRDPRTGKGAPQDDDNPIPVHFLTVPAGMRFAFAAGARRAAPHAQDAAAWAEKRLKSALMELGVGAKTAAGYGNFVET